MSNSYLLLYNGGKMPETDGERKTTMDAWNAWFAKHGPAITDAGNPFSSEARTISPEGKVTTGAHAAASGYTVIKADSIDKALEIAKGCPVLLGGASVSVFETFDVMTMAPAKA